MWMLLAKENIFMLEFLVDCIAVLLRRTITLRILTANLQNGYAI
jgi:hypothetical protein